MSVNGLLITCADHRFQQQLHRWAKKKFGKNGYDRVSVAGAGHPLNESFIIEQTNLLYAAHGTPKIILVNHEDCAKYGEGQTRRHHYADLRKLCGQLARDMGVEVEGYFLDLAMKFTKVYPQKRRSTK